MVNIHTMDIFINKGECIRRLGKKEVSINGNLGGCPGGEVAAFDWSSKRSPLNCL